MWLKNKKIIKAIKKQNDTMYIKIWKHILEEESKFSFALFFATWDYLLCPMLLLMSFAMFPWCQLEETSGIDGNELSSSYLIILLIVSNFDYKHCIKLKFINQH